MKVLHLISGGDSGGAKTHVFALLDALKKLADVKIICLVPGVFYQEILERGINVELIEQKSRFDISVAHSIREIIKNEGFELLHVHGARANFVATSIKKYIKIPVVTTMHSDYLLDFDGIYRKLVYTTLNILALRKIDYYIAVSSDFKKMLIDRNFRPNKIFTVYNGMDYNDAISYDEKEKFAERIGVPYNPNDIYVGIIGRHDFVKGHDIFIRGAKLVADKCEHVKFIIAGEGEGQPALRKMAGDLGISDRVIFAGFIKDIYSFINFIDINTLTSRSESFPYVLLEGARLQKPTISSAVGGIPDLIRHNETGLLFENKNYEDFANQIIRLVNDNDLRKSLGEALYKRATENFSNQALATAHLNIYKSILSDAGDEKKYDVVLSGYYGFDNSGDDALLYAILEGLKKHMPYLRTMVLSAKPLETKRQYRVDTAYRFNPFSVIKALKSTKMLINGGGSLIQDVTSQQSLLYYLLVMHLAKKYGAKVYIYANGIGPLRKSNIAIARKIIDKADMITLRDSASMDELHKMNVTKPPVFITADPAVTLKGSENITEIFKKAGIPEGKYIGISVRQWHENDKLIVEKIAGVLDRTCKKHDLIPIFIPMKYPDDIKISCNIAGKMKVNSYVLKKKYSFQDIIGIVRHTDLILGMRLHTLIYAGGNGIPVVGLVYDPKVSGFLDYISQPCYINVKDIDEEKLCRLIDDVCENYDEIKSKLTEKASELYIKADDNARLAEDILNLSVD